MKQVDEIDKFYSKDRDENSKLHKASAERI